MSETNPDFMYYIRFLGYGAFAMFAGLCGHLLRSMDDNKPLVWKRALVEGASAGFVGVLVLMTCDAMKLSPEWTGVIVGVSGWLGANATIQLLERVILKKLGLSKKEHEEDPQ